MPPIDPTILALLSIFGGVLLTIVAAGIGALLQRGHEHSKWLRDQRLRAYVEHLAASDDFLRAAQQGDDSELRPVSAAAIRALSAVQLVGPEHVYDAAVEFQNAMKRSVRALENSSANLDAAEDARLAARKAFLEAAQKEAGAR